MTQGTAGRVATATPTQLLLALGWLGACMYFTHFAITGSQELSGAPATWTAALPGVVAAMLFAGATIGAAFGQPVRTASGRLVAGLAVGTALGLVAATGVRFAYGSGASATELAIAIGGAAIVGGALAVLPSGVLKAGLWGTTWVFVAGMLFGVSESRLAEFLGDDALGPGRSLAMGVIAALCTVPVLRVERHRVLWSGVSGALPGLVLLGAELADQAAAGVADSTELRPALIVVATGGLIGMVAGALRSLWSWARRRHRAAGVDISHLGVARIGLTAGQPYGFVLSGSYAMQAAGFLTRPSEDVDLFTVWDRRSDFETATQAIVDAYRAAGFSVAVDRRHDTFTRLTVSDGVRTATVELGLNFRTHEPVQTSIGLVLHPDDAVANKMRALYERAHASDFVDIDAVVRSGRYDRAALVRIAERSDISFTSGVLADALAQAQVLDEAEFARYGVVGAELDGLRQRFADWRATLLNAVEPAP